MARQGIVSDRLPDPVGPYSHVAKVGNIVAVAGQAGLDPQTGIVAGPDIETQAEQTFRNIATALALVGAGMADVIQTRVYLADLGDFATMNDVYGQHFQAPYPARTTVAVQLPANLRIEVDVLAVLERM